MTKSITMNYAVAAALTAAMVLAFFASAATASAAMNSSSIFISTTNQGTIGNLTEAMSHSGFNSALGSVGGTGGVGGAVVSDGSNNNGAASAGDGGAGGNGGEGGLVETGDTDAVAGTENGLNGTDIDVQVPTDMNSSSADVVTDNDDPFNVIANATRGDARSGENSALGSVGGDGSDGGVVAGGQGDYNNGGAASGTGGAGGAGNVGGTIRTGASRSEAGTINLLNTSIIRVRN